MTPKRIQEIRTALEEVEEWAPGEWCSAPSKKLNEYGIEKELPQVWDGSGDSLINLLPAPPTPDPSHPYFEPEVANFIAKSKTYIQELLAEIEKYCVQKT